jgi:hypothetical protein
VIRLPFQQRVPYVFIAFLIATVSLSAQISTQTSQPAIPMREESHHHLIFQNSYVNVFFVEIPAHETTLPHHHDFPYVSVPPGGEDAAPPRPGAAAPSAPYVPHVGYAAGNFSHAVTNSSNVTLRNIAVELVRPQGTVRDRCAAILPNQPTDTCEESKLTAVRPSKHTPLLETDEILVESWELGPNATTPPLDDRLDMLVGELTNVSVTGGSGLDSVNALRGGLLWVPAGSKPVFKGGSDRGGHFITITFKDSASAPR